MATIEICVDDEAGAMAAIAGGADRIEVCAALELGGLTPSPMLLQRVLRRAKPAGVAVHAMVRPRAGDFVYDENETMLAIEEGRTLLAAGADGLVFGACRDGALDFRSLEIWSDAFRNGPQLTLHRAIDLVTDLPGAVMRAIDLGFARILSSGGATTALAGADTLRRMVEAAGDRCLIAAGAGVRADNVAALIARSGVREVHGSASSPQVGVDAAVIALGFASGPRRETDRQQVETLCAAARDAKPN